jgi:hypothetical protein
VAEAQDITVGHKHPSGKRLFHPIVIIWSNRFEQGDIEPLADHGSSVCDRARG